MKSKTVTTALFLFGLVAAFTLGIGSVSSQQPATDLPPQVIDVFPLPGVELAPQEILTVTFNQAMNQPTVETAFQFEPAIEGTFNWADARTVVFSPAHGWQRATEYTVTILPSAAATNGLTLPDPYVFQVRTVGNISITAVTPADGAEGVAADAQVVVTFNRPVVPLVSTEQLGDLPNPLVIDPEIAGKGEWLNTSIYAFTPDDVWQGGSTYRLSISPDLSGFDGAVLADGFSWSFKTLPPQILNIDPWASANRVELERNVTVNFSQPMDRPSTESAFQLLSRGEAVSGKFSWNENSTILTFDPDDSLRIESEYTITIAPSARSAFGEATLASGQTQVFSTVPLPGIEITYPQNGERGVRPGSGVSIEFKSPMDTNTFEDKVLIEPQTEWTPSVWNNESLYLNFASLPNTRYTITFKAGAQDVYGNAISTDYIFTYETGAIETWAYPLTNQTFQTTGAHRQDTRVALIISGTPRVNFSVYRLPDSALPEVMSRYWGWYEEDAPSWEKDENLVRSWRQDFDSGGVSGIPKEVLLASEEGGLLPTGVYWIKLDIANNSYYQNTYRFALGVVTANLTVKRTPDQLMTWVTDMESGEPVAETTVTIYYKNEAIARGQTNAEGIFQAPVTVPTNDAFVSVIAQDSETYAVWSSAYANTLPTQQGYLYTDRSIYRPGETVYFRGVVRDRNDMAYRVPNLRTIEVWINAPDGIELYRETVELTPFGTFSGELLLPEETALGSAYIGSNLGAFISFEVAEFRVPEFEVSVTAQQEFIFVNDSLTALAKASYYFGGSVSNAPVNWIVSGSPSFFNYTGDGNYSFQDYWDWWYYAYYYTSGTTDADGQYLISIDSVVPSPLPTQPMALTIEANVTDESNQVISGRTTTILHPANIYLGMRSDKYFGRENDPITVDMIAVDATSVPLADKRIEVRLVEVRWERIPIEGQFGRYNWQQTEIEIETTTLRSDESGKATYTFSPPNAGIFRVIVSALDERERSNSNSMRFWVMGTQPVWWGEPSTELDLIADADSYKPGDTAEILVPIPFAGKSTVLITTERAGIMSYEVREIEGSTLLYELPITEAFVPTVYVDVTVVKGIDEENAHPEYRTGQIGLVVEPVAQRLNVTIKPSAELTQPREMVTLEVETTDAEGNPVTAEVGIAMTDKAILALLGPNSGTLEDTFYGYQSNYIYTSISLTSLIDKLVEDYVGEEQESGDDQQRALATPTAQPTGQALPSAAEQNQFGAADGAPGGGGGGGGPTEVVVRENFEQTPLWLAHVVTDATGKATVTVELPDNLTTWTLDARGLTIETEVGQTTGEIVTTLPLLLRPATPRFFVVGDRVQLGTVVNNNTAEAQTVEVSLESSGVTVESDVKQTVTIAPQSRARIEWTVVALDVDYINLTFVAIGANGYTDASKPALATGPDGTIPVYRYTSPDTVGTGGILREGTSRTEGISLPPRVDTKEGELTVRIDPSLAVTTIDSFDYLKNFPHQCIEQTVSRFLPNMTTYRALKDLGIQDPVLEANLATALNEALAKLTAEQNPDGGWGWFGFMESNPYVTAYALLGLIEARDAGFDVQRDMIDRAENYIRTQFITPRLETSDWQLNRQAFYFYVLAQDGKGSVQQFDQLYEYRLKMTYAGRAFLLMSYQKLDPTNAKIADLVSDLTTAAKLSATGAHWEEDYNDWWNWSSDTRTTAIVLKALVGVIPDNDLLPNAVRWLMVARKGDHWQTTQETAWGVMALTDWMVTTGELQGQYAYSVVLNEATLTSAEVTPDTVREGQVLRVAVGDLLLEEINRLTVVRGEGNGVLYYTAHLETRLPVAEVDALNRGIGVTREYFLESNPETPITGAQIGDVITVRLTINLSEDIYYFVLEDPLPAGAESVNRRLLTTSQFIDPPTLRRQKEDSYFFDLYNPYWYWGWWWFDHTELRDEQTNLYADFLPRGTYVYTYQMRATTAGEFQTRPSHAYAFYFPEVFGRTDGSLFTILPAAEEATE